MSDGLAYFCTVSGIRIVAPGVAKSAGGEVEEHAETLPPLTWNGIPAPSTPIAIPRRPKTTRTASTAPADASADAVATPNTSTEET